MGKLSIGNKRVFRFLPVILLIAFMITLFLDMLQIEIMLKLKQNLNYKMNHAMKYGIFKDLTN